VLNTHFLSKKKTRKTQIFL